MAKQAERTSFPRAFCTLVLKAIALFWLAVVSMPPSAEAHESRPAYLQIRETKPGQYDVLWRLPVNVEVPLLVMLQLPEAAKNLIEPVVQRLSDSTIERRRIELPNSELAGQRIDFVGLQATITDVLVRVSWLDGRQVTEIVRPTRPWIELTDSQSAWQVAKTYATLGIEHILMGIDHLLFAGHGKCPDSIHVGKQAQIGSLHRLQFGAFYLAQYLAPAHSFPDIHVAEIGHAGVDLDYHTHHMTGIDRYLGRIKLRRLRLFIVMMMGRGRRAKHGRIGMRPCLLLQTSQ